MSQTSTGESVQAGRSIKMLLAALPVGCVSLIFVAGFFGALYAIFFERSAVFTPLVVAAMCAPPALILIGGAGNRRGRFCQA